MFFNAPCVVTDSMQVIPKRPDLKIVLMSATLDADKFSKYFFGVTRHCRCNASLFHLFQAVR